MPRFYCGDLLFLTNPPGQHYHTGDTTVYRIPGAEIPIMHCIDSSSSSLSTTVPCTNYTPKEMVRNYNDKPPQHKTAKLKLPPGEHQLMLMKGDNNHVDDIDLYWGLEWLDQRYIIGKVHGYVFLPHIGYVMIAMNDFTQLKYALLRGLELLAVIQWE
ncbi:hypothetical protein BDR06DRAFT_890855 [Suillus hirtellus]|nr:hypothetical protein BDR06DRAFT_890855 [Suillus hirtellus]